MAATDGRGRFGTFTFDTAARVGAVDKLFRAADGVTVTAWDSKTGGTRVIDLLDANGQPVEQILTARGGQYEFWGPIDVHGLWVDAGGPERERALSAQAVDVTAANAEASTTAAQAAEDAANRAASYLSPFAFDTDGIPYLTGNGTGVATDTDGIPYLTLIGA